MTQKEPPPPHPCSNLLLPHTMGQGRPLLHGGLAPLHQGEFPSGLQNPLHFPKEADGIFHLVEDIHHEGEGDSLLFQGKGASVGAHALDIPDPKAPPPLLQSLQHGVGDVQGVEGGIKPEHPRCGQGKVADAATDVRHGILRGESQRLQGLLRGQLPPSLLGVQTTSMRWVEWSMHPDSSFQKGLGRTGADPPNPR